MTVAFTDQRGRIRRTLENALEGCLYESSREEPERMTVIEARRVGGTKVGVRFRGVHESKSTAEPPKGTPLHVRSVGSAIGFSLFRLLPPWSGHNLDFVASRVRIDAGDARLEVVCEDVEWWQDEASPSRSDA